MTRPVVNFLCAGASQGLLRAIEPAFCAETGAELRGRFGAVGVIKEALLSGEPCDLLVLTEAMIDALVAEGRVSAEGRAPLGRVRTGVAVKRGHALPDVGTPDALRAALLAADAVYFPDPVRATAGVHFARVMQSLGVADTLQPRLRPFPNGATAMRELGASTALRPIGCTQVTEILYTPEVELVAVLPREFELATVYTAAIATGAAEPALARRLLGRLTGADTRSLRAAGGFED
jgi:molybdate transport system substrate-binding protein